MTLARQAGMYEAGAVGARARWTMWQPVSAAPFDLDLQLAVIDNVGEAHALVFPCRRILGGWIDTESKRRLDLIPTHWRPWREDGA